MKAKVQSAPPARTSWPPLIDGGWIGTHRLIPDAYAQQPRPYLADLIDPGGSDQLDALSELAAATNMRLLTQDGRSTVAIEPNELVFELDHSQVINGAFTYPRVGGARFNDRTRGAWYAAAELETSLAEVAFHKSAEWAEINRWDQQAVYVDFRADIAGRHFADLSGNDPRSLECRQPDPVTYVYGQRLAQALLPLGAAGVVYPSVRHPSGICIACFRPALLPPVTQANSYLLTWSGTPEFTVTASSTPP